MVVIAGSCYVAAGVQAAESLLHRALWDWSMLAGPAAGWAGGMLGVTAFIRLEGDQRRDQGVRRAVNAGELPAEARPEEWGPGLKRYVREARRLRTAVVVLLGSIAVLVAAAAAVTNDNSGAVWTLALLLAAFIALPFSWLSGRMRRAGRLLDTLRPTLDGR